MDQKGDSVNSALGVSRRSVLSGIGGTVATGAITSTVALAKKEGKSVQYVGKSYDPLTDKEQGDASAALNLTRNGLKGRLRIAGFDIPVGQSNRITDGNNHEKVETYRFVRDEARLAVVEDDERLPLKGFVSILDGLASGLLTRPSPEYGNIAFSLNPSEQGFSAADIGRSLRPEQKVKGIPGAERVSIPATGIPKSNSINNVRRIVNANTQRPSGDSSGSGSTFDLVTADASANDIGTASVEDNQDVGFLDATSGGETTLTSYYSDECIYGGGDRSMSWNLECGTSGEVRRNTDGSIWSDYDEIVSTNAKRWQLQAHFSKVPDTYVEDCDSDDGVPYQTKVEFKIDQANSTDVNEVGLEQPEPNDKDDESSPDDGLVGLALDITNSVSGPYGSVASTIIDYALSASSGTDLTVKNNTTYSEGVRIKSSITGTFHSMDTRTTRTGTTTSVTTLRTMLVSVFRSRTSQRPVTRTTLTATACTRSVIWTTLVMHVRVRVVRRSSRRRGTSGTTIRSPASRSNTERLPQITTLWHPIIAERF